MPKNKQMKRSIFSTGRGNVFLRFVATTGVIALAFAGRTADALVSQALYNFQMGPASPQASLVKAGDGNFYGTTPDGGVSGDGSIFCVTPDGVLTVVVSMSASNQAPSAGLAAGLDGALYGLSSEGGGPAGWGTIFRMTTDGALTTLAEFDGTNGGNPQSALTLAPDGNFYGVTPEGGSEGLGNIFRVTTNGVITSLHEFKGEDATNGYMPTASLVVGMDGSLYGTTTGGGMGAGTVFRISTSGAFSTVAVLDGTDAAGSLARLTLGGDGNLYGVAQSGGAYDAGDVFRVAPNGAVAAVHSFMSRDAGGSVPAAELALGPDGGLYGTTSQGGAAGFGTVFKITTAGEFTALYSFSNLPRQYPQAGLALGDDGDFYGLTTASAFKMTPAGVIVWVSPIFPLTGSQPVGGLLAGPDGNFYGTTRNGGSNGMGTIFRLTSQGVLTPLFSFSAATGSAPQGGLALGNDGAFYGTTSTGGPYFLGTVFRFSTNGSFTILSGFNGANGSNPQGGLVSDSQGNLYGIAPEQGPAAYGVIYRIATNGDVATLVSFNQTNGGNPEDGLVLGQDGNLYGTTADGGALAQGTVFRVTPDGALTTLATFNKVNGAIPLGGLLQGNDGTFYGTTAYGDTNSPYGTIFKLTPDGNLTTLYDLRFADGEQPSSKLIFARDGNLYGVTGYGGTTGDNPGGIGFGTLFRVTTNGDFAPLVLFQGTNGSSPQGPLTLGLDGNLYGETANGGPGGGGTIFRIVLTPSFVGINPVNSGTFQLTGSGPPGASYRLWTTTNLPVFRTLLQSGSFDTNGAFSVIDSTPTPSGARFYRISVP